MPDMLREESSIRWSSEEETVGVEGGPMIKMVRGENNTTVEVQDGTDRGKHPNFHA